MRLLNNAELLEQLATNGNAYVRSKFDWEIVGDEYVRIIDTLIKETL